MRKGIPVPETGIPFTIIVRSGRLFSGAGLPVAAQGGGDAELERGAHAPQDAKPREAALCAGVGGGNAAGRGGNGDDNAALAGTDGTRAAGTEHRREFPQ